MSNAIFITFIHPNINISGNPHNHGEGFEAALDFPPQQSGGPSPQNQAKTFEGPPTLEQSGYEHRTGRLHPLVPEGREAW